MVPDISAIATAQYEQDPRNANTSMDTSPIPPPDLSPDSLPSIASSHSEVSLQKSSSHIMHTMPPAFPNKADHPNSMATAMHVSMPDLTPPVYMAAPVDVLDLSASVGPSAPSFIPDFPSSQCDPFTMAPSLESDMNPELSPNSHVSSVSPPQSQVPSPSIHGSASSYAVGGVSSLASALDATNVSGGRSRAGTSVSPASLPLAFISAAPSSQQNMGVSFPPSNGDDASVGKVENSADTHVILGNILKNIAQTANSAGDACRLRQGAEASSKVDELKGLISLVSDMMSLSLSDNKFSNPSYSMTNGNTDYRTPPRSTIPIIEQEQHPLAFPPSSVTIDPSAMDLSGQLSVSDQSRKRCASAVEEERRAKAPKREPQDDVPLLVPSTEGLFPVETSPIFPSGVPLPVAAVHTVPVPPHPTTSSRPTTPPGSFGNHLSFSPVKLQPPTTHMTLDYSPFLPSGPPTLPFLAERPLTPPLDFDSNLTTPVVPATAPFPPTLRSSWSDSVMPSQHQRGLSSSSATGNLTDLQSIKMAGPATVTSTGIETLPPHPLPSQQLPGTNGTSAIGPPLGRMSRSGSISGPFTNPFPYGYSDRPPDPGSSLWSKLSSAAASTSAAVVPQNWYGGNLEGSAPSAPTSSVPSSASESPPTDDEDDAEDDEDDPDGSPSRGTHQLPSADNPGGPSSGSDIPQEYRLEVDRIFFEYLNKICSNLDATDSKGEPIHQTLMAKKMQRLDESPDFRPFKFRIQAFTLAFLEELARQGYPEEKIPMKKIRNYLWRQQYILRFNEDGKKAKSKGNHIWNIEAKKAGDGKWEFRPFHRKLAGSPPGVAYCGLRWSWTPRIWDPQASWQNIPVQYSSPSLPAWLSWKDDVLSGIPPPDAESCKITANAKFILDGQEGHLSHAFSLNMAPVSTIDSSFSQSRRASFDHPPRRSSSDSVLPQVAQRSMQRGQPGIGPSSPGSSARVIQILQSAAQRVEQETHSQMISSFPPKEGQIEDLVKQKHVLEQTVTAYGGELSGRTEGPQSQNRVLAVAAQNVVVQAAQTVIADRTAAVAGLPISPAQSTAMQQVTVNEVSVATQDAIAKAVKINGTSSTEVDIILTATSILHEQARAPGSPPGMLDVSQQASTEPTRPHTTGTLPSRSLPLLAAMPNTLPPSLPPLSEYLSLP